MIGMIPETQTLEIKESLKDITLNVLKILFVPLPDNENIQFRSCQVFGTMGSGKTSLYRFLGQKAIDNYGEKDVNPIISSSMDALVEGINAQAIQVLFLDDAGLETQSVAEDLVAKFTFIRHVFEEKRAVVGKKNGVIIIFFAVQDYFLLAKKLRSTLHVEIFKHAPTNRSDISKIKMFLGDLAIKVLETISRKIFEEHKYDSLSTCIAKTISSKVGFFNYDFIPREESILIELEPTEEIAKTYSITDGDYTFLELKEFEGNDLIIEALSNWKSIKKKIRLKTKKLQQKHIDAFIKYLEGYPYNRIAEIFNVADSSIVNNYKNSGWMAIVRTELIGHLVEYQLTQEGEYYEGYERIAGNARVDLMSPDKDKAIEVKVREQRETPTAKMLSGEMLKLLEEGFSCELFYCILRSNKVICHVLEIIQKFRNSESNESKTLYDLSPSPVPEKVVEKEKDKDQAAGKKASKGSKDKEKSKKERRGKKIGVIK